MFNRKSPVIYIILLIAVSFMMVISVSAQENVIITADTQDTQYGVTTGTVSTDLPQQTPDINNITIFVNKTNATIVSLTATAIDNANNTVELVDTLVPMNTDSIIQNDMLAGMKSGYNLQAKTSDGRTIVWRQLGLSSTDIIYLKADGTFYNLPSFNAKMNI